MVIGAEDCTAANPPYVPCRDLFGERYSRATEARNEDEAKRIAMRLFGLSQLENKKRPTYGPCSYTDYVMGWHWSGGGVDASLGCCPCCPGEGRALWYCKALY